MSVENQQVGDSTAGSISQQQSEKADENPILGEGKDGAEKVEGEANACSAHDLEVAAEARVSASRDGNEENLVCVKTNARKWIEKAALEEKVWALGFSDGPFLSTLLDLASWSPSQQLQVTSTTPELDKAIRVDWGKMVSIRFVEETYNNYETRWMEGGDGPSAGLTGETVVSKAEDDSMARERAIESDAYRIRTESEAVEHDSSDITSEEQEADAPACLPVGNIFDNVCVVFPAAFSHILGGSTDEERLPFVTLRPYYVENTPAEKVFLFLDELSRSVFASSFLSHSCSLDDSSWLKRLARDGAHTAGAEKVPIWSLLIARMELAVRQAYERATEDDLSLAISKDSTVSSNSQVTKGSADNVLTQNLVSSCGEGDYARRHPFRPAKESIVELLSFLHSLETLAGKVGTQTARDVTKPFTDVVFGGSPSYVTSDVRHIVIPPLPYLLKVVGGPRIDLGQVDDAVRFALTKLGKVGACPEKVRQPPSTEENTDERDPADGTSQYRKAALEEDPEEDLVKPEKEKISQVQECAKSKGKDAPPSGSRKKRKKNKKKKRHSRPSHSSTASVVHGERDEVSPKKENSESDLVLPFASHSVEANASALGGGTGIQSKLSDETPVEEEYIVAADSASLQSELSGIDERPESLTEAGKGDITIARVEGVLVVAAPLAQSKSSVVESSNQVAHSEGQGIHKDDGDTWETVEVRGRGNRKKSSDRSSVSLRQSNQSGSFASLASGGDSQSIGGKKPKVRTAASRKRNATRKIVREILFSLLDTVDDEVRKKRAPPIAPATASSNPWKNGPPIPKSASVARKDAKPAAGVNGTGRKEATLRDIVLGRHATNASTVAHVDSVHSSKNDQRSSVRREEQTKLASSVRKGTESPGRIVVSKRSKLPAGADQNTAPTYQETVSAVSASSNIVGDSKGRPRNPERVSKSDSSSGDTNEALQNSAPLPISTSGKDSSPAPPLPTLLSPESANSANSSVASSLEVPHARHHSSSTADVNDVGYHLLDVCDRLSRDLSLFMSKRARALSTRRRERGALLASLQDTVASLWPGRCQVELYGSCAVNLDLPSSDLDVVVIGLDRGTDMMMGPQMSQKLAKSKSFSSETVSSNQSIEEGGGEEETRPIPQSHRFSVPSYMHLTMNGERVMRLAAALETQPWAVKINAIPTASVPVVKILADPSRLTGSGIKSDWVAQQQQLADARHGDTSLLTAEERSSPGGHQGVSEHIYQPWRGSDVMNGLLALDITFEGPEHGGLGSTEFSMHVINEACQDSGLAPEGTPLVQVLLVLKELLAQRKLNEPYSGGLSSYALLLLLVSLLRERAVIRHEIERVEMQRQAVAAGDVNSAFKSPGIQEQDLDMRSDPSFMVDSVERFAAESVGERSSNAKQTEASESVSKKMTKSSSPASRTSLEKKLGKKTQSSNSPKKTGPSSWATIARKQSSQNGGTKCGKEKQVAEGGQTKQKDPNKTEQMPSTFADALAKNTQPGKATVVASASTKAKSCRSSDDGTKVSGSGRPVSVKASETNRPSVDHRQTESLAGSVNSQVADSTHTSLVALPTFFPQGYNDVIEVLCSGETTAGKLLMHFLLYYGQHFDAQTTAIDISGKHERDFTGQLPYYPYFSPYISRRAQGTIDPITGMLSVHPIVIYDPLEGAEFTNVSRRCFAWNSVRWIFAQSYSTLSSAVERSATPPAVAGGVTTATVLPSNPTEESGEAGTMADLSNPSSPLLRCLLSF